MGAQGNTFVSFLCFHEANNLYLWSSASSSDLHHSLSLLFCHVVVSHILDMRCCYELFIMEESSPYSSRTSVLALTLLVGLFGCYLHLLFVGIWDVVGI